MVQKKASSSGGPLVAKGKAKAKAGHGASLLEQTEDTAQAGQRERKRVRNLEEQVSKVLRDNFRGVFRRAGGFDDRRRGQFVAAPDQ